MPEFMSLSGDDLSQYAEQMTRVKFRIDAGYDFLQPPHVYPRVESGLLQVRQALESVMLSSLITNRTAVEQVASAFATKSHDATLKIVRRVNPRFWPEPIVEVRDGGPVVRWERVLEGFLTEEAYLPTWGRVSEWLHATNPFVAMRNPADGVRLGLETLGSLVVLLNLHTVHLLERDELILCMMEEANSGRVHVNGFGRASDEALDLK